MIKRDQNLYACFGIDFIFLNKYISYHQLSHQSILPLSTYFFFIIISHTRFDFALSKDTQPDVGLAIESIKNSFIKNL